MTEMKRMTISLPDDLADQIAELRMTPEFENCSYSEIIRRLMARGLNANQKVQAG